MTDIYRVWGAVAPDTGFDTSTELCDSKISKSNQIITMARIWVIGIADPVFTNLFMRVFSNRNGQPGKVLAQSSSVVTRTEMVDFLTQTGQYSAGCSYVMGIPFAFDNFNLKQDETYHFVLNANGYAPSEPAHLEWMKAYPDPPYREGTTVNLVSQSKNPYALIFQGAEI